MNRNELFRLQKAELDAARARRLALAKAEAYADGKEPFYLDEMDRLWRDNPDRRLMAQGLTILPELSCCRGAAAKQSCVALSDCCQKRCNSSPEQRALA
jgi:hypothetical protein